MHELKDLLLPASQQDSAWKEILDIYFHEFMHFFFPVFATQINWDIDYVVLDTELQSITTDAKIGKRIVDKLIQVQSLQGDVYLVLLHIEIQGSKEISFPERLYQCNYRLYDRYKMPVLTLAILTDANPSWRPNSYKVSIWNTDVLSFYFATVKLLNYFEQTEILETTTNPFGIVVLAQLAALKTRGKINDRFEQKFALARRLYHCGLDRNKIINLYKFIDWVLTLPEDLEIRYNHCIQQLDEERTMGYITSGERIAIKKGYEQGMQQGKQEGEYELLLRLLERKFQYLSPDYRQRLAQADAATLLIWGERLLDAKKLEDIFN